jgi:hypothetical protein
MAVGDAYQIRVYCYDTSLTQVAINTVYYVVTVNAGTGALDVQVGALIDQNIGAGYKACLSVNAAYRGLTVQKVATIAGPVIPPLIPIPVNANAGPGTVAGNTLPGQVSGLISWKSAFSGPGYRGRVYIPFPGASASDANGKMVAAYQALLGALAADFNAGGTAGVGGNTSQVKLALRTCLNPSRPPGTAPTYQFNQVVSFVEPLAFATQRRRGQFGRINALPF